MAAEYMANTIDAHFNNGAPFFLLLLLPGNCAVIFNVYDWPDTRDRVEWAEVDEAACIPHSYFDTDGNSLPEFELRLGLGAAAMTQMLAGTGTNPLTVPISDAGIAFCRSSFFTDPHGNLHPVIFSLF